MSIGMVESFPPFKASSSAKQISSISNFKCVRNYYCDDYYSVYIMAKPLKNSLASTISRQQVKLEFFIAGYLNFLLNHFLIFMCGRMLIKFLLFLH